MKTVLIIPSYNEGGTLHELVAAVLQQPQFVDQLIVVDDGSTDGSVSALPEHSRLRVIRHARNEGKARALIDGMQLALQLGGQRVVTIDGDGQHRTQDIARLIQAADEQPGSIVIGARLSDRESIPTARYRANRFANFWIAWASGYPVVDSQSGFRLYPAEVLRAVLPRLARRYPLRAHSRRKGFVFESEVLIAAGRLRVDTVAVTVPALYGTSRASHFRPVADITQIVLMVAAHLLRRGLYPRGLWRSLMQPARRFAH
jgi:glycosyltransferase involved in cell wall biosynthesis